MKWFPVILIGILLYIVEAHHDVNHDAIKAELTATETADPRCISISSYDINKEFLLAISSDLTEFLTLVKRCVQHHYTVSQNWETTVDFFVRILNNYATYKDINDIKDKLDDIISILPENAQNKMKIILEVTGNKNALISQHKEPLAINRDVSSVDIAKFLITTGADLHAEKYGNNALHIAAESGNIKVIEWLINTQHFDINKPGIGDRTPIFLALLMNQPNTVKWIAENTNVDLNKADDNGQTTLSRSLRDPTLAIYLIKHLNNTIDDNIVLTASTDQLVSLEVLKYIIENTNFDLKTNKAIKIPFVTTYDKLKYLIEKGADINMKDSSNKTVLHYLTKDKYKNDLFKWVVENTSIDINAQDENNETALFFAITDVDKMKLLVKHGGDINIKNKFDQSILYKAKEGLNNRLYELFYHTSKEKIQEVVDYLESLQKEKSE